MTEIIRGGQAGSPDDINVSQGDYRAQLAAITDAVRQLGGNPKIAPGGTTVNDPLSAPYVLYVNSYTGKDTFVAGDYASADDGSFEQKMKRISLQRLECGYTEARPFRTVNRAIIEAGIITSRDYLTLGNICGDLISIVLAPGTHTVLNDTGAASTSAWSDGDVPTDSDLIAFNPQAKGGLILPRGCSLVSLDLRKCILRPNFVPGVADEAPDRSNRSAIFRMTGGGYYYGMTFLDKLNATSSHHLLSCFEYASQSQLDEFYGKVRSSFSAVANIDSSIAVTRESEYVIVGPAPETSPTAASDTVVSASPYVYNCSIRSVLGLAGIYCDGSQVEGLKSCVVAQLTGVSLQKDLSCWQVYNAITDSWDQLTSVDFNTYRDTDPDNIRMDPNRLSFHVRAVNGSVIQEVSVFAIGQGIHHWVQDGGEITVTNSNSNFGGCAALAEDYRTKSLPGDTDWTVNKIVVSNDMSSTTERSVRKIFLGKVEANVANNATTIVLEFPLEASPRDENIPLVLDAQSYTLKDSSYLWIENSGGKNFRARLKAVSWDPATPNQLLVKESFQNEESISPGQELNPKQFAGDLNGSRVYVRRVNDIRSASERRYTLLLNNTSTVSRNPLRDYTIQTDILGSSISAEIPTNACITVQAAAPKKISGAGVERSTEVELRRQNADNSWFANTYYRKGDIVQYIGKHWICIKRNDDSNFDGNKWKENYVHMEDQYRSEDFFKNNAPVIIFDNDTDGNQETTDCGYSFPSVWTSDNEIEKQYISATDYKAIFSFVASLGFSNTDVRTLLKPKPESSRQRDPISGLDGVSAPSGAANSWANWPVQFRRPSQIRLFGHAYEWAGYLNYTKALPKYQGELSRPNKFTYYFTNKNGGKVYASGFNEEGFAVTPRGLEDVSTGDILSTEELGIEDTEIVFPTFYESLSVNELQVNNELNVTGVNIIGLLPDPEAQTEVQGEGEIASVSEIVNTLSAPTDELLNTQGAKFVTVGGLKYWAQWARVVTKRPGITDVYVVPDNAVINGTYNFNGTSASLSLDPDRNATNDPPFSREFAVTLGRATAFANDNFSAEETVRYNLANGPYWNGDQTFNHEVIIQGATAQFPSTNVVANFNSSVKPTTDVKALMDGMNIPVFATRTTTSLSAGTRRSTIVARPLLLKLDQGGTINGVGWLGAEETFNDTTNFPDSIFGDIGDYRNSATVAEGIDNWLNSSSVPSNYIFDKYTATSTIRITDKNLTIKNVTFGASAPGLGSIGYRGINPIVFTAGTCNVNFAGVYLLGNITANNFPLAVAKGISVSGLVTGTRHSDELIGGITSTSKSVELGVYFPAVSAINELLGSAERDIDVNCIHLLDNNGRYALMSNRNATNGTRGPVFRRIIGQLPAGSKLYTGGYASYKTGFTVPGHQHGWAGVFGTQDGDTEGPQGIIPSVQPLSLQRNASYHNAVWQQARTGTLVTANTTATVTSGGVQKAYDVSSNNFLNVNSSAWYRGVDVANGQVVGGFLISDRFYG